MTMYQCKVKEALARPGTSVFLTGAATEGAELTEEQLRKLSYRIPECMPGSPRYSKKYLNEAMAAAKKFGAPHFMVTGLCEQMRACLPLSGCHNAAYLPHPASCSVRKQVAWHCCSHDG